MSASQPALFNIQEFTDAGVTLVGGRLYTYAFGTTTQKIAYTDSDGTIPHTYTADGVGGQYIALDARGELPTPLYLADGAYDISLKRADGSTVWTRRADGVGNALITFILALAASMGSALIGWMQSGVGAVLRTVQSKLRDYVSVKDFGAVGDGIADDSVAIQAAVTSHLNVYLPPGDYLCNDIINLREGSNLFGAGMKATRIVRNGNNVGGQGVLYANSGSPSILLDGIVVRDMMLDGQVAALGFSEHRHLISLNGVRNARIERVKFLGFRGDGLYIGTGLSGEERHNKDCVVRDSVFDGVNKDNRNAISVIDVDGMLISGNSFENTTRSTMPGAIDFEPNGTAAEVIKNITVTDNTFRNIGGNVGVISLAIAAATPAASGVVIRGNKFYNVSIVLTVSMNRAPSASTTDSGIIFTGNYANTINKPFQIFGCRGVTISENVFSTALGTSLVGYEAVSSNVRDITISSNRFIECAYSSVGVVVQVYGVDHLIIDANHFENCGRGLAGSNVINFSGTGSPTSSYIRMLNNTITNSAGKALIAIGKDPTHTFTPATNHEWGNEWAGLVTAFDSGGVYTPIITGGTGTEGTGTYTTQTGYYVLNGKLCTVYANIAWTAHTGSGQLRLTLPFATKSRSGLNFPGTSLVSNITFTGTFIGTYAASGQSFALFSQNATGVPASNVVMNASGSITIALTYEIQ